MKIVVLDGYAGNPGDLSWKKLKELGECAIYDRTSTDEIVTRAKDADAVLTNKVPLDSTIIAALPKLKYIGILATGVNVVDIEAAKKHGIVVTNVPNYRTDSVAQFVFAHLFNICCHVRHYTTEIRDGKWSHCKDFSYFNTPIVELAGKTMGIVGLGNIGMQVARMALVMNMKVQAYTSKEQKDLPEGITKAELDDLFKTSDVVSLHCPLTPATEHMVNRKRLHSMKAHAILINTSRGGLVNEADLADCLDKGGLLGAGIDVMEQEPPQLDNPLLRARNCYITPHIAWASKEARIRLMDEIVKNLKGYIDGKPVNVVK